jgi:type II secretory pathway pseudopilin PulG
VHAPQRRTSAFTLVELLVVVAIIVLLLGMLLPQLRRSIVQARSTVCKANLHDLGHSLQMYRMENLGWLPVPDDPRIRSATSWASAVFRDQPSGRWTLVCPSDSWSPLLRRNLAFGVPDYADTSSYGMNDFILSSPQSMLANLDIFKPRRPAETILLADMGPDTMIANIENYDGRRRANSRNLGRLEVDDGYTPGTPAQVLPQPWLTPRHGHTINVLTVSGVVRSVVTDQALGRRIQSYYPNCAAQFCTLCIGLQMQMPHYSFAESQAFWWTGPVPNF